MARRHGRITNEDILEAGFRRWDGKNRITTDWLNIFDEPELQWPNGDVLVYLREPGQSSRGPSFRVHSSRLRSKGFNALLEQCMQRPLFSQTRCVTAHCTGCGVHAPALELYIPAPPRSGLIETLEHHVATRNFFAWLYKIPLTGKALGRSLVALKARLDAYRPLETQKNTASLIAFAGAQRYLDFRECVDHAMAALHVAETLHIKDMWVDAFAHCVGLSHRGLKGSVEYEQLSGTSKLLIKKARLELDAKLGRINHSVASFFEDDLAGDFLGMSQVAQDHLDRFRSFLHSFYIEQHGFWPPIEYDKASIQKQICTSLYADFKSLYHHLADENESGESVDLVNSGGICTLQNIQALDAKYLYQPLPHRLPVLPTYEPAEAPIKSSKSQRRNSWNPVLKRRLDREERNARRVQALIDSSNRDWVLMNCPLVRRYSDFEAESAVDELETITLSEGRKVRWIAVYAILQMLISAVEAPKQVRNIEGLSYSLCCRAPLLLPWEKAAPTTSQVDLKQELEPDLSYSHTNTTGEPVARGLTRQPTNKSTSSTIKERRKTLNHETSSKSAPSTPRRKSLKRLMSKRSDVALPDLPKSRASFCEIFVPGYGNGLNHAEVTAIPPLKTSKLSHLIVKSNKKDEEDHVPRLPDGNSVSRESSNASNTSSRSTASTQSADELVTPTDTDMKGLGGFRVHTIEALFKPSTRNAIEVKSRNIDVIDLETGLETVHFNTQTWDDMLRL